MSGPRSINGYIKRDRQEIARTEADIVRLRAMLEIEEDRLAGQRRRLAANLEWKRVNDATRESAAS